MEHVLKYLVGKRLAEMRENEMQLSQVKFARVAGISLSHLRSIENGETDIQLDTFERLIDALGVTPVEFYSGINYKKQQ